MEVILKNLTKRYPNRNKKSREDVIAVNDFTFEIPDGKLIGLLGPSGCGKSTTLNLISVPAERFSLAKTMSPTFLRKAEESVWYFKTMPFILI